MIKIKKFSKNNYAAWDSFVLEANNGTLFHLRKFLSYHPEGRFNDHSVEIYKKNSLLSVFPAADIIINDKKMLISHPGSSYGSFVSKEGLSIKDAMEMVSKLIDYSSKEGFDGIQLTIPPGFHSNRVSNYIEYSLLINGFDYLRRDVTSILTIESSEDKILNKIIKPTLEGLSNLGTEYKGFLYAGLMIVNNEPYLIEYNVRMGDPECQTIMPLMDQNFVFLLEKCSMGKLTGDEKIDTSDKVSGCVIATSKGYPNEYKTGFPIKIGEIESNDCQIFDSGTSFNENGELVTDGGRVLSIVCQDKDFDMVFEKIYKNLKEIDFEGIYYRNDIGHQVRKNFSKEN